MIVRTYTDEGELIHEHKISDINNYAELYDIFYIMMLRRFNNKHIIKLCLNLLRKSSIDSQITKEIEEHLEKIRDLEIIEMRKDITNRLNKLEE